MTHSPATLEASARLDFERRGWTYLPGFFSAAETAAIDRSIEEIRALPEVPGAQMVYRETSRTDPARRIIQRIEDFCPYHAEVDALVRGGRLQQIVEQVVGAPVVLFKDKINFKMAGGGGFEPHQDQQAGWSRYAPEFVTAMVSIDRATLENGCLEMTQSPRLRRLIGNEWEPLTEADLKGLALTPIPTEPGDVLLFDSFAPHASKPNHGSSQRRILYITYNLAAHGDHRARYFADKRASFPPDVERRPGVEYVYRV